MEETCTEHLLFREVTTPLLAIEICCCSIASSSACGSQVILSSSSMQHTPMIGRAIVCGVNRLPAYAKYAQWYVVLIDF